jgi:hypothetical protein
MMKGLILVLLLTATVAFAEDFSIYPLTPAPSEFGTHFHSLEGLELPPASPTLEAFSMQYVYPSDDVLYSMEFVEPDPNTDFSMYMPEVRPAEPQLKPDFLNP